MVSISARFLLWVMPVRRPLVAGNWKMHGTRDVARRLLEALRASLAGLGSETLVCPPYPLLDLAAETLRGSGIRLGAQNLHERPEGAFTGEVSGVQLCEAGCAYVIVGHSERRQFFGEDSAVVADKAVAALRDGLTPIVCVGESADERARDQTFAVIGAQFATIVERLGAERLTEIVLAYEPVWAIGTGLTATPQQAQEVHAWLRERLGAAGAATRILYGGSVKAANARELFAMPDIDGGLVGGASLVATEFTAICMASEGS